jgi:Holliday junction resolvase RusA-like endonuclease
MRLTIKGQVISLKNRKQIITVGGRPRLIPSKLHKAWEEETLWQLNGKKPIENYPVSMAVTFYCKDRRKRDLDNMLTSIQDVLVKANILEGDDWSKLSDITISYGGYDKANPRAEIYIYEEK